MSVSIIKGTNCWDGDVLCITFVRVQLLEMWLLVFVQFHSENNWLLCEVRQFVFKFYDGCLWEILFYFFQACVNDKARTNEFLQGSSWVIYW